jgi:hypothetical protein
MIDTESWIYKSGDIFLPKEVRTFLKQYWVGNDKSIFYITNWTFVHMLSGVLTAYTLSIWFPKVSLFWTGLLIHTLWELWQMAIGMTNIRTLRGQVDTVVDTLAFLIGMYLYTLR